MIFWLYRFVVMRRPREGRRSLWLGRWRFSLADLPPNLQLLKLQVQCSAPASDTFAQPRQVGVFGVESLPGLWPLASDKS